MSDKARICNRSKTIWHKNPISGHEWSTQEPLEGFEVIGPGVCQATTHWTIKNAEAEKLLRDEMYKKYPFIMPRSKREIAKCKRLRLSVPKPYIEMETGKLIS